MSSLNKMNNTTIIDSTDEPGRQVFLNCTELDLLYSEMMHHVSSSSSTFWGVAGTCILIVSMVLVSYGEHIMRFTIGTVSACFGFLLGFALSDYVGSLACEVRLVIAAVFGIICALFTICILKVGFFIIGGVSFGLFAHFAYEVLPYHTFPVIFMFQGRNGIYWIVVLVAGLIGAIVGLVFKKQFLRIGSSLLGGCGIGVSVYIFANKVGDSQVPEIVILIVAITFTAAGIGLQTYISKKITEKKKKKEKKDLTKKKEEDS